MILDYLEVVLSWDWQVEVCFLPVQCKDLDFPIH